MTIWDFWNAHEVIATLAFLALTFIVTVGINYISAPWAAAFTVKWTPLTYEEVTEEITEEPDAIEKESTDES